MKKINSILLLGLLVLAFTGCNSKESTEEVSTMVTNNSVVAPDSDGLYTQEATSIIIGTVRDYTSERSSVIIDVEEVLKGDISMTELTVPARDPFSSMYVEDSATLFPKQHVLLFLGTDAAGAPVIYAGSMGVYTIDGKNTVTSESGSQMTLEEVKAKIQANL